MEIKINENSCIIDGVEYVKKEQKEQLTPKDGEVWCVETGSKWIIIVKYWGDSIRDYCAYSYSTGNLFFGENANNDKLCNNYDVANAYIPTLEEIELLHSKLAENGKRWNAEKKCLEDLPKPLKEGDLAIFWDLDRSGAIIAKYEYTHSPENLPIKSNKSWHQTNRGVYQNAIPFESIEQYKQFITVHES